MLISVLIAVLMLTGLTTAEAGQRRERTSPIYPYPGGPEPVHCHCETHIVDQLVEVTYIDNRGHVRFGYYWRRVYKPAVVCHPSHGRYHTQED